MSGAIYACFGLLVAPILLAAGVFGSGTAAEQPCRGFIGIVAAVIAPIFCGVRGFVCGAIGGLPHNLFARTVGGLELELEPKPNIPVAP